MTATRHGIQQWLKEWKNHVGLVRNQAIIPQELSKITEQPIKATDIGEKVEPNTLSLRFTPPDSQLPLLPLQSLLHKAAKVSFLSQIMSWLLQTPSLTFMEHASHSEPLHKLFLLPEILLPQISMRLIPLNLLNCYPHSEACPYHPV